MKEPTTLPLINPSAKTVGDIVADDYRTAKVFEKHGIDFCCGGKVRLATICTERGLDPATIMAELAALKEVPIERSQDYAAWELPFLADYIITVHHGYLQENTTKIADYAHKIAAVHGDHHPEVIEIASIFGTMAAALADHLQEEEQVFFPALKRAAASRKNGSAPAEVDLETIKTSLTKLTREHQEIGDAVHAIRHLAHDYAIPGDVCNTFVITYQNLREFEEDLHKHVHLENNILFLKAAQLLQQAY